MSLSGWSSLIGGIIAFTGYWYPSLALVGGVIAILGGIGGLMGDSTQ